MLAGASSGCWRRTSRSCRSPSPASAPARRAPGIDPLDPRNLELEPRLPGRVVRRLGRGPRPPVLPPAPGARPLGRPARDDRVLPARSRGGARPPARAGRPVRRRRQRGVARGQGGVGLLRRHGGPAAAHLVRVAGQPRGRRPRSTWPAWCSRRSLGEGLRPRPRARRCGSAPRWWAARTAACRSPSATAWTASSPTTRRTTAARLVELVRDPGLAVEMGRAGRERVRERFLVTAAAERELRALAELALTAVGPPPDHRLPWSPVKVLLPDGKALELSGRRHRRRRRRAPSARAWPGPRSESASARTAPGPSCATCRAPLPDGAEHRDRHGQDARAGPGPAVADPPRRRPRARHGGHRALPRASRSRSARRSRTASTTTSSSPRA